MDNNPEAGCWYLPTGFTGTYTDTLSGNDVHFPMVSADSGCFNTLEGGEN